MNCFEFLGLSKDHRALGKVVQLVKNYDEVTPKNRVYPLLGQVKYDGVFAMLIVKPDRTAIFGRTGKQLSLLEGTCAKYSFLKPGVYIGELCLPGKSLEVLSGIVNPSRTNVLDPTLMNYWIQNREMHFHDFLTTEEFIIGQSDNSYSSGGAILSLLVCLAFALLIFTPLLMLRYLLRLVLIRDTRG